MDAHCWNTKTRLYTRSNADTVKPFVGNIIIIIIFVRNPRPCANDTPSALSWRDGLYIGVRVLYARGGGEDRRGKIKNPPYPYGCCSERAKKMYKRRVTVIAPDVDDSVPCSLPPLFSRAGATPAGLVPRRRRKPPSPRSEHIRVYRRTRCRPPFTSPRTHKNVCCSKDHCVKITSSLRADRITSSRGKNMYIAHINMYAPRRAPATLAGLSWIRQRTRVYAKNKNTRVPKGAKGVNDVRIMVFCSSPQACAHAHAPHVTDIFLRKSYKHGHTQSEYIYILALSTGFVPAHTQHFLCRAPCRSRSQWNNTYNNHYGNGIKGIFFFFGMFIPMWFLPV